MSQASLDAMIRLAGARLASDLAFEPSDSGELIVLVRVDGTRIEIGRIEAALAAQTVSRLKGLAGLPAYITDEAQDGRIDGRAFDIPGDLRAAFLPTVRGQRAALRLPAIGRLPTPDGLGFPETVTTAMRAAVRLPNGLVIVAGPTGSGKTTTLHSLIAELARERPDRHILTIEDPVERRLEGITQVEIASDRGQGFTASLSASLRHDPDVIVVGEVRDPLTAQACVRAALTGHLVLTTIHAGRAVEVVPRLFEMGVEPELLLPTLSTVMAQRLVRRQHRECVGHGCPRCSGGFLGRQAIADVLRIDSELRNGPRRLDRIPLLADLDHQALDLLSSGITTAQELERVIG